MLYREIKFKVILQEKLKRFPISCDEARLSIILYNLFSNSVKHTTDGHITLKCNIIDHTEVSRLQKKHFDLQSQYASTVRNQKQDDDDESLSSCDEGDGDIMSRMKSY